MKVTLMVILSILLVLPLGSVSCNGSHKTPSPTITSSPTPTITESASPSPLPRLSRTANFLEQLYNPSIGLCRETLISESQNETIMTSNGQNYTGTTDKIYWIASDNYLESLAIRPYNQTLSENIKKTCDSYLQKSILQGLPHSPYQIMEGKEIPLTLHIVNNYVLEQAADHIIGLNISNGPINGTTYFDYPSHGDMLVYEAINYYIQGYPLNWCQDLYMEAYNMFDGKGVADKHFKSTSHYDNMKLALLVFGAKVLNLNETLTLNGNLAPIEQQLWLAQAETGGITSCMNSNGQPVGTSNGETAALTLLAYDDNLISQIQSKRKRVTPKNSMGATFPPTTFNQTTSITDNIVSIPLLDNWKVTINNTVQWATTTNNPRIALGLLSSLASSGDPSIQLVAYKDGSLDVIAHDKDHPNGYKVPTPPTLKWANPVMISLLSGNLTISSQTGSYDVRISSFPLAYITGGSTESDMCVGGKVDVEVEVVK